MQLRDILRIFNFYAPWPMLTLHKLELRMGFLYMLMPYGILSGNFVT